MDTLETLLAFLDRLEAGQIFYRIGKVRDAIMVEVAVPGQRWEVEFFADGHIEREVFQSTDGVGDVDGFAALEELVAPWFDARELPPKGPE